MKNTLTLGLLIISASVFSQETITVKEEMVAIDGTSRNSLTVMLAGSKTDDAKKAWKKQLKDLKGKVSDKTIIFGDDCKLKEMTDNTFDVYSLVEDATSEGVRLVAAFDLGGAYLSTAAHPSMYPAAENLIRNFAVEERKRVIAAEIENNQKILKGFEKELSDFEKQKSDYEATIKDYEKKIEGSKVEIEKNLENQANKKKEIEGMKVIVTELEVKGENIK